MGWSSGTDLMSDVINIIKTNVKNEKSRKDIYTELIEAFEDQDWDCQMECCDLDTVYDAALKEMYPEWFNNDN